MDKITLKADKRTIKGKKVKNLRKQGLLPANIYGKDIKSETIQMPIKEFDNVYKKAGETGLIDLVLNETKIPVITHLVQIDPVSQEPLHVDFYKVNLKEKIKANVPLFVVNESPAVKDKVGVLLTLLTEVEVEALPAEIPDKISVDISSLKEIDQTIKVTDLKTEKGIAILTDGNLDVVKIAPLVSKEAEEMAKEEAQAKVAAITEETAKETEIGENPAEVTTQENTPEKTKEK
jgi:large subunit ribosomal protein L25